MRHPTAVLLLALAWIGAWLPPTGAQAREAAPTPIAIKGSGTLWPLVQRWVDAYQESQPPVTITVEGGGSGSGIAALIRHQVDLASTSREFKPHELLAAEGNGLTPKPHVVAHDALALYVHPSNPLEELSLPQLADMYGDKGGTSSWSQLGVEVPGCPQQRITLVSRHNVSGSYEFFRQHVVGAERELQLGTRDLAGARDVVDLVAHTPCAIGFSGLAYATPRVKVLKLKATADSPAVPPSTATALNRTYPLARPLYLYSREEPRGEIRAFLDWVITDAGQCIAARLGFPPIRVMECSR